MTLQKWERSTNWPLTVMAVVFLGCYAWPILQPTLNGSVVHTLSAVSIAIWVAFAVDYLASGYLADNRVEYAKRHIPELAMLILPVLRPLRALRVMLALRAVNRSATMKFRGQATIYVAGAVPLLVFVASLSILNAERTNADANIRSYGDALWWACTTITTVGYGDKYPVTTEGRFIAVTLMVAGIALLGVVTAALASWFVERIGRVEAAEAQTQRDLDVVLAELRALREEVNETT